MLCDFCKESGSPICLRKTFQGQGELLAPLPPGTLVSCRHKDDPLPFSSSLESPPPYQKGEIPEGYHRLSEEHDNLPKEDEPPSDN